MTEELKLEANKLIDVLSDQIDSLHNFSVDNDDLFDVQLASLDQLVKDLRKQLL